MSLQDVERAIKRVRVHLHEFQRDHPRGPMNLDAPANNVEMSTRYIVVDPVLRSLGWDLSDPSQCIVEYATAGGSGSLPRVDYALIGRDGCPVVLVEAKRLLLSGRMASNEDHSRARKVKWDKAYYALCDYLNGVNVNDVDAVKVGVLTGLLLMGRSGRLFRLRTRSGCLMTSLSVWVPGGSEPMPDG